MWIKKRRAWDIVPASEATPESVYLSRRQILKAAAAGTGALLLGPSSLLWADDPKKDEGKKDEKPSPYPGRLNQKFKLDRPKTDEKVAATYNNFYEFTTKKSVFEHVDAFKPEPWKLEVTGLCAKPQTFDLDDLRKIDHEERLYRHRCVEAWSMAVPWEGFQLSKFLEKVEPKSEAKYVRFISFHRPEECPGIAQHPEYPFPYFEALTIDEAKNELALLATGIYGKAMPKVHGAPVRTVIPWKYGYKSSKSIVKIELTDFKPETFWHKLAPEEYGFFSNVNPDVPHPRWKQSSERLIGTEERKNTLIYNGYTALVADLYKDMKLEKAGD
ncbi:protein-methionine-sulfoxide reductase catalytic subunit MsrP [bacterium]|nr:protein-methionine-sulfoxide reductase catalytic subunit MsrP [bacterium]